MTHLSLFSGIGGIDLAAEWAGFETVAFCERDAFCQKILAKHWPGIPIYDDIHTLDGTAFRGISIITGGFPCQPFSQAGKRAGAKDDRALWPQMLRVIREARPAWVIGENVAGILSMVEFEQVCASLESEDYEVEPILLPAAGVGAWHFRKRIFIVAHAPSEQDHRIGRDSELGRLAVGRLQQATLRDNGKTDHNSLNGCSANVPHTANDRPPLAGISRNGRTGFADNGNVRNSDDAGSQGHGRSDECSDEWLTWTASKPLESIWLAEPAVGRVAHGVPGRVDRLKSLGNAVVPQQIYPILKAIADIIQAE